MGVRSAVKSISENSRADSFGTPADHWDGLGRRNIEAGIPVLCAGGAVEVLLSDLLSPTCFVATAHEEILADHCGHRRENLGLEFRLGRKAT